jgi:hypothetical protein
MEDSLQAMPAKISDNQTGRGADGLSKAVLASSSI